MSEQRHKIPRTICDCCGKAMPKAHGVYDGKGYCTACYYRLTKSVSCTECGKPTRIMEGGEAVCKSCRAKGRKCIRCGKDVPRAALTVEDGVACPSCARFFKEPRACPVCGQLSLHLSRDLKNGFTEPVCQRCRRKRHITCPCCGKNRRPAGTTSDGRVVCKDCLVLDGKPFMCPICGKEGKRHSKRMCVDCYWLQYMERRTRDAVALIRNRWLADSFHSFIRELSGQLGSHSLVPRFERYFLFFATLDGKDMAPEEVTPEALASLFGADGLRRHAVPFGFMVKHGLLPQIPENIIEEESERRRQEAILSRTDVKWTQELLRAFHAHLLTIQFRYQSRGWVGERRRFVPRTITSALRTAADFMEMASEKCVSVQQIDQVLLERFVAMNPGKANGIRAFVRFLCRGKRLFRKLKVPTVRQNMSMDTFLSYQRYGELLRTWLNSDEATLKESLICLLMLLYGQTVKKTVRLRLSGLAKKQDGSYRIVLGRSEITLDRDVSDLLSKYIESRKALSVMEDEWENDYLFPGRKRGEHLSEGAVSYYLKKHGVTAEMLFASAILYAYQGGITQPKVLVKAFGITDATAIKYLNMINPRLREEAEKLVANG